MIAAMGKSSVEKVFCIQEAPLRQRLRSANDASTYAWCCIFRSGAQCAPFDKRWNNRLP